MSDTEVSMEQIRSYADRMLAAMPTPSAEEGGDRVLMPALAFASVMLLWAAAREDWRQMFALMKAYHKAITAFHQSIVQTDCDIRKAAVKPQPEESPDENS